MILLVLSFSGSTKILLLLTNKGKSPSVSSIIAHFPGNLCLPLLILPTVMGKNKMKNQQQRNKQNLSCLLFIYTLRQKLSITLPTGIYLITSVLCSFINICTCYTFTPLCAESSVTIKTYIALFVVNSQTFKYTYPLFWTTWNYIVLTGFTVQQEHVLLQIMQEKCLILLSKVVIILISLNSKHISHFPSILFSIFYNNDFSL